MQRENNKFHSTKTHITTEFLSRRDALKLLGTTSTGIIFAHSGIIYGQSDNITIAGKTVGIAVSTLSSQTIRITVLPIQNGRTVDLSEDGAVVGEEKDKQLISDSTMKTFEPVYTDNLVVKFTDKPPTLQIETLEGKLVQRLKLDAQEAGLSFLLSEGPLLGLGQGGPQFDRKGTTDRMRSGQGGYQLSTHGARVPIQWLIGTDGWGMFIHNPLGSFDFTGAEGKFTPSSDSLPMDIFIVSSSDPKEIMQEYARITGYAELPAIWTLGYLQSHRTLAGPEEVLDVANTIRQKKLPCDGLIYLGTEFTPSGWNTRNGEFTWHSGNFPDPKGMIEALHQQNFKVVLHVVIEGRRLTGTVHEICDPNDAVPSGRTEDGRWPRDRSVPCYWPYHKPLFDIGVDGWWPDQGDGLDAASRLNRHRMYWEGSQLWRPNERPFALHRNGYAGMQRFAAFLWSGDVQSRWETLRMHVPIAVNTGLSGIPYWGTDIGGFVPTSEYTGELHIRWFQFGAFCTCFRAHGRNWHLRLPWGWNGGDGGPDETRSFNPDPEELKNPQVERILKKYLELRYRMLPYMYTAVQECCETGLPIMRALWLHYPDDPEAVARGNQFLWGRDVLVSPVVEKGATNRRLYLPRGDWFDFWSEEQLEGNREIDREVDLETTPLHIRAGAILPLGPVKQYADEQIDAPLTLIIYPGANGSSSLYEDDGRTFDYRKGEWMRIEMDWQDTNRRLRLRLTDGSKILPPIKRTIKIRVAGEATIQTVVFNGEPIEVSI